MPIRTLETDPRWGMKCVGYHIQGRPDRNSIDRLIELQRRAAEASPVTLRLIPPKALHASVFTFLPAQPESCEADDRWDEIAAAMTDGPAQFSYRGQPVQIVLSQMSFTSRAVIALTRTQPEPFLSMRERLATLLGSLGLPVLPYDQTHVTIARYAEAGRIDGAALQIEQMPIDCRVRFEASRLVRERQYPSLVIENL